uniref:Uncharacterized protein n=1 Tax=Ciona savignyi TaxID=51511 RepID=H2ZEX6_CIOSA
MRERRPSIYQSMPLIAFEEAICSFNKVNSDAASKSNVLASKPQFPSVRSACETFCQDLIEQKKMNIDSNSKYFYLTMLLVVLCGSLLYYDVTSHGSWATSATHKFLDSNGVLKFMEQIKMKTMNLYDLSANWLKNNIPYYWDMTKLHLGPYIAKLVEVGMDCWTWLGNVTKPALASISYHCYDGLAKVESWSRTAASYCLHQWDDLVAFCWPYLVICAEHISVFYSWVLDVARGEADWQSTSDNIHNFALNVVSMANAIVQNITKLVSNYIAPSQP